MRILRTERLNNYTKLQRHAWDDHQFKEEGNGSVGELFYGLLTNCSQMSLSGYVLGDLTFHGLVNKLARAVKKWTKFCDKRLARSISYAHHTSEHRQYCHVGNTTAQQCRAWIISRLSFCRRSRRLKINIRKGLGVFSGVTHVCANKSRMCARNRLPFHTVLQELTLFPLMQVYAWTVFPLSRFGVW